MDPHKLKNLQVQKARLEEELRDLRGQYKKMGNSINALSSNLNNINRELSNYNNTQPSISEHALLRYVERVQGVDLEKIKKEILSEKNIAIIDQLRSCNLPLNDKYRVVVKNKVVVTVEGL